MTHRTTTDRLYGSGLLRLAETEYRQGELRRMAEQDHLARLVRGPRPLRRRVGRMLIAAGMSLAGTSLPPWPAQGGIALG